MTEAAVMGAPVDAEIAAPPRGSYWTLVGRAYWRFFSAKIASLWILLIALISVLVPFIANEAPFTAIINGQREFPLFKDLTRVDWAWFVSAGGAVVYALIHWRIGRRALEPEKRSRRRRNAVLLVTGIVAVVAISIGIFKTDYLDARDYHRMADRGQLTSATFPPLRWGYRDQEPLEKDRVFEFPTHDHILGTDGNGRDVLARLIWGTRIVLEIGLISEVISLVIGVIYGALMGYFVGTVDLLGMRLVEIVESIPTLFLLITFIALFGRELFMIMVILGITGWTGIARFVRAEFFRIRQADYVYAAKAMGLPLRSILFRHMLPNGLTPVIVSFTFGVAGNVGNESILSFLGVGVEPPTPSWGVMLNEAGNPAETFRWWLAIAPGLLIFLTVFAYNIVGEGLRDAIDPRTNKVI